MRKTRPLMRLSLEEEKFLRHWMHDEVHYQDQVGLAKRLQVQHGIPPADLATLIAAAMPDPLDQEAAAQDPLPSEPPTWPWKRTSCPVLPRDATPPRGIRRATTVDGVIGAVDRFFPGPDPKAAIVTVFLDEPSFVTIFPEA